METQLRTSLAIVGDSIVLWEWLILVLAVVFFHHFNFNWFICDEFTASLPFKFIHCVFGIWVWYRKLKYGCKFFFFSNAPSLLHWKKTKISLIWVLVFWEKSAEEGSEWEKAVWGNSNFGISLNLDYRREKSAWLKPPQIKLDLI